MDCCLLSSNVAQDELRLELSDNQTSTSTSRRLASAGVGLEDASDKQTLGGMNRADRCLRQGNAADALLVRMVGASTSRRLQGLANSLRDSPPECPADAASSASVPAASLGLPMHGPP